MFKLFRQMLLAGLFIALTLSSSCTHKVSQMEIDLSNANWVFYEKDSSNVLPAQVPGSVHMDLFRNNLIPDPYYRNNEKDLQWIGERVWFYNTQFDVTKDFLLMDNIDMKFEGLDTYAEVYLNDSLILNADNFFKEWSVEAKSLLQVGINKLSIKFNSAVDYCDQQKENCAIPLDDPYAYSRKPAYHFGWDWGPVFITSGVWKPIKLEAWNNARITNVQIVQNELNEKSAELTCVYEIESDKDLNVEIRTGYLQDVVKTTASIKAGINKVNVKVSIPEPKLWWSYGLGEAHLYDIKSELLVNGSICDEDNERIGLRTVKLLQKPDSIGKSFHFELNGVPVFMKGANYIPQDMFLNRPEASDYQTVIDNALAANMNILRVWGGGFYENDLFYDLCDENGLLVWQDFMFACAMYPGDEAYLNSVRDEAIQNVKRLRNHASIALWCGNNENYIGWQDWGWSNKLSKEDSTSMWNDYENLFHDLLPEVIAEYDANRFYWPSSPLKGWGYPVHEEGDVHYWGIWHAQEPFENFQKTEAIGRFMSEYGFQGCPEMSSVEKFTLPEDHDINSEVMLAHQKHRIGYPVIDKYMDWYYNTPKDFEAYLYVSQVQQAFGMGIAFEAHRRAMPHCMGTLYWQINDCYPVTSWASVDCYGKWKALHYKTRDLFEEIIISPFEKDGALDIHIISDRLSDVNAKLELSLYDFKGKLLNNLVSDLVIKANTSSIYLSETVAELLKGKNRTEVVLVAELKDDITSIYKTEYFFDLPKNLALSECNIKVESNKTDKGTELTFTSDVFAKDVFLSTRSGEGSFSNNFFNLIPGKSVKVLLSDYPTTEDVNDELKVYSLINSY